MNAMNKKSKSNLVTLSLIPKENIQELKKSKSMSLFLMSLVFLSHSYVMRDNEQSKSTR